ncbi:HNH endonuclease signature motif containing protein [Luteimicrobium album]|uniref:HNH endonuclease signature motif containing protein n=1 Tax=Luteimicrobium album TaxID=1054550 RepID=UPI0032AFBA91
MPADLRRHLAVRDGTCRFPGCGRPAARCDTDHVTAFVDGGATDAANLLHLCRRQHRLKHETSWCVRVDQRTHDAVWTSPTGRQHVVPPAVVVGGDPPKGSPPTSPPPTSPPPTGNRDGTGPPPF